MTSFLSGFGTGAGSPAGPENTDPIRDALTKVMGITLPTAVAPSSAGAAADVAADNSGNTFGWGAPQQTGISGMDLIFGLPYGLEAAELLAWYWNGGGRDIQKGEYLAPNNRALGTIVAVAKASLIDAETFTLDDGVSLDVFEFDGVSAPVDGVVAGRRVVDVESATTDIEVAAAMVAAINAATNLRLSASNGGTATVSIQNMDEGASGEVITWDDTVANAGFVVTNPTLAAAIAAGSALNVEPFLSRLGVAEAGGWWKEAISARILDAGEYSNGQPIRMRLFGFGQTVLNGVFPNVTTPSASIGQGALDDWKSGNFNALEFGSPELDSFGGLFPSSTRSPDVVVKDGSIIAAGATDYYQTSWWQPYVPNELWVNKVWYGGLGADDKEKLAICARHSLAATMAREGQAQAGLVRQFQAHGVTLHKEWPHDVQQRLRQASPGVLDAAAATRNSSFQVVLDHMRDFIAAEQNMWNNSFGRRADRWKWAGGWADQTTL